MTTPKTALSLLLAAAAAAACAPSSQEVSRASAPTAAAPSSAPAPATAPETPPAPTPSLANFVTGSEPGNRIPDFKAMVRRTEGGSVREETVQSRAAKGTTVYVVMSTRCPYCNQFAEAIKSVEAAYMTRGVDVVHVYPVRAEPDEEKIAWHAKKGFRGGLVLDGDAAISKALEANKTPTAYLVDSTGVIAYRGAVQAELPGGMGPTPCLAQAVDAVLAGKPVAVQAVDPEG